MSLRVTLLRAMAIATALLLIALVGLLTVLSALVSTQSGSQWVLRKGIARLQSEEQRLSVGSSTGTLLWGMGIRDLQLQAGDNTLSIAQLRAQWNPLSLLSGAVDIESVEVNGVHVRWQSAADAASDTDPFAGLDALPWPVEIGALTLTDADIVWEGQHTPLESLHLSAKLSGRELQFGTFALLAGPLQLEGALAGELRVPLPLQGQVAWQFAGDPATGLNTLRGQVRAEGSLNQLHVIHRLEQPVQIETTGDIMLSLYGTPTPQALALDLSHTLPGQRIQLPPWGDSQALQVQEAQVRTAGTLTRLAVEGAADLRVEDALGAALSPDLSLTWDILWDALQLDITQLQVRSDSGQLAAVGRLSWREAPSLSLTVSAQESDIARYQSLLPEGLELGELALTASVEGQRTDSGLQGRIDFDTLTGELNGFPLSARGAIAVDEQGVRIDDVQARSGDAELTLTGRWEESIDLAWHLSAQDLSTLSPAWSGALSANGAIEGSTTAPRLTLAAHGEALALAGIRLGEISATGTYAQGSNRLEATLKSLATETQGTLVEDARVLLSGQPDAHTLDLQLQAPEADVSLRLTGALAANAPLRWDGVVQQARITSGLGAWALSAATPLRVENNALHWDRHCWSQDQSAFCLEGQLTQQGELNTEATLTNYPLSHFNAAQPGAASATPYAPLLPQLPPGSQALGSLTASVAAQGPLSPLGALDLRFALSAGEGQWQVEAPALDTSEAASASPNASADVERFFWRAADLNGSLAQGAWQLDGTVDFYQPDLGDSGLSVQGNAQATLSILADRRLDGELTLAFQDLSWIEAFLPSLQNIQGQLRGLTILSGSLDAPKIGGTITLSNGAVEVPAAGLLLTDINSSLTSDGDQTVFIQGRARSGEGTLRMTSEISAPLSPARRVSMSLNGEDFTLVDNGELRMTISPALELTGDAGALDIRGSLLLPVVDVQLTALPESAVDVSPDTVIIQSAENGVTVHNAAQADRGILDGVDLTAALNIALGDQARFRGFGLDTRLTGALDITQRATGAPLTYGELTVLEGNYQTYGRTLDIEHGKLLFFGSMENPALDIRAVRQAEDVKVGVQMNGTLQNIRSQLFSTPTLPDGDIVAVLLTGRPLSEIGNQDSNALIGAITTLGINQGQSLTNQIRNQLGLDTLAITSTGDTSNSSLTLGKYLTPRIFIRYGVGLFETQSTLSVDYSVTDRIKLEAKSGSTQSVDIKYTVER